MAQLLAAPVLGVLDVVAALVVVLAVSVLGLLSLVVAAEPSAALSLFFAPPPLLL
jgi:hypothetical protein